MTKTIVFLSTDGKLVRSAANIVDQHQEKRTAGMSAAFVSRLRSLYVRYYVLDEIAVFLLNL